MNRKLLKVGAAALAGAGLVGLLSNRGQEQRVSIPGPLGEAGYECVFEMPPEVGSLSSSSEYLRGLRNVRKEARDFELGFNQLRCYSLAATLGLRSLSKGQDIEKLAREVDSDGDKKFEPSEIAAYK